MSKRTVYAVKRGCTACGTCMVLCPAEAIDVTEKGAEISASRCRGCGLCADNCPVEAIVQITIEDNPGLPGGDRSIQK